MRLVLLLGCSLPLLIFASSWVDKQRDEKDANLLRWSALPSEADLKADDGKTLVFVNVLWRHGDRSPTEGMPGDKLNEDSWQFGGGGYGQLSPLGMEQHFALGRWMRRRYVDSKYLSPYYRAKEIYLMATDVNRTLISAMSNMAGMYSGLGDLLSRPGVDYPDGLLGAWPSGLVPVPVHTQMAHQDYLGSRVSCPRKGQLWEMAQETKEYKDFHNSDQTKATLKTLTDALGHHIHVGNIGTVRDVLMIERQNFPQQFYTWYPWYTADLEAKTVNIDNKDTDFYHGQFDNGVTDSGVDLKVEIPKLRAGVLVNEIKLQSDAVVNCYRNKTLNQAAPCHPDDHYHQNLKYHVFSMHDTNVDALLSVLGARRKVFFPENYPHYTSSVLTEFYYDKNTDGTFFKVLFFLGVENSTIPSDPNKPFTVITSFVEGCGAGDYCDIKAYHALADKFNPVDPHKLCHTPPNGWSTVAPSSPSTSPASISSPASPVTGATNGGSSESPSSPPTIPPTTQSASNHLYLATFAIILAVFAF